MAIFCVPLCSIKSLQSLAKHEELLKYSLHRIDRGSTEHQHRYFMHRWIWYHKAQWQSNLFHILNQLQRSLTYLGTEMKWTGRILVSFHLPLICHLQGGTVQLFLFIVLLELLSTYWETPPMDPSQGNNIWFHISWWLEELTHLPKLFNWW